MMHRCYNYEDKGFNNYGGRGITVSEEWHDVETFVKDCIQELGWKKGLQIDRATNSEGYSLYNCQFVTASVNCCNRRRKNSSLKYEGVRQSPSGRWCARVTYEGKTYPVGTFDSPEDAVTARNQMIRDNGWPHKQQPLLISN